MPELLWAQGGDCRNFCGLGGGLCRNFCVLGRQVRRNFCGLREGYAGTSGGSGGMPELMWAHWRVCRNFCGLKGGDAGTNVGLADIWLTPLTGSGSAQFSSRCSNVSTRGGCAGTFVNSGGGVSWSYCGLRGGGMPELLWA